MARAIRLGPPDRPGRLPVDSELRVEKTKLSAPVHAVLVKYQRRRLTTEKHCCSVLVVMETRILDSDGEQPEAQAGPKSWRSSFKFRVA
jgi:hypothetical protein